jgi:hypothetical protein
LPCCKPVLNSTSAHALSAVVRAETYFFWFTCLRFCVGGSGVNQHVLIDQHMLIGVLC